GSGSVIGAKAVTAGGSFTGYAITRDAYGNFVANPSATWTMTSTTGGVTGTDLSPASGASSTFTGHLVGTGVVHAVVGALTAHSGTVTVSAGSATPATGYPGTVHFPSTDGAASLPANYTFVAGDAGAHSFAGGVTLKTAGSRSVTGTDTVTGTITGSQTVTVNPGAATKLALSGLSTQPPNTAQSLTVTAQDAYGNTATGYTGAVHFTSSDGAASLPANYTFLAGDAGVHSFASGVTLKTAGSKSVTGTDTVTGTITGTQTVTVNPGSATQLVLSGLSTQTAGTAQR